MLNKIKELNEALPGMMLLDFLYLCIGELVILLFIPNMEYAVGLLAGVLYAVFGSFQMSHQIRKVVYGRANARKTYLIGYFIRLAVMIIVFAILYIFHIGDLLCALIGMFSMKVSAYLQPLTHKLYNKIKKGR